MEESVTLLGDNGGYFGKREEYRRFFAGYGMQGNAGFTVVGEYGNCVAAITLSGDVLVIGRLESIRGERILEGFGHHNSLLCQYGTYN